MQWQPWPAPLHRQGGTCILSDLSPEYRPLLRAYYPLVVNYCIHILMFWNELELDNILQLIK